MAGAREMAQEYAKSGFGSIFIMNGGAAVALLSQAADLVKNGLNDEVGTALLFWGFGVAADPLSWLCGFLSLRFVDRSEQLGRDAARELRTSDRWMFVGIAFYLFSVTGFVMGCISLAATLGSAPQ